MADVPRDHTCNHPECTADAVIGIGREWYCGEHADYGLGRVFGPLHRALDAARKAGL